MLYNLTVQRLLASAIGDSFELDPSSSTIIPDGARFTALERANYINRALMATYSDIMRIIAPLERKDALTAAKRLIPGYIKNASGLINVQPGNPIIAELTVDSPVLYVFEASGLSNLTLPNGNQGFISIKVMLDANDVTDVRLGIRPDPVLVPLGTINQALRVQLWDENNILDPLYNVSITYLCEPKQVGKASDDIIELDDIYLQRIVALASMYAWDDTQDLENAQILSQQIQPLSIEKGVKYADRIQ